MEKNSGAPAMDLESIKKRAYRPRRAVVTAGMPYANGPVHLGHLAGAMIPPDIHARYLRMLIGEKNVLFVSGTDDHGSTSELSALQAGQPIREFIDTIHARQKRTLDRYSISLNVYSGTSRPECFPTHAALAQDFLKRLHANGMLEKRASRQWFDPKLGRFLQDRFVRGKCPNPKCDSESAYSDECDRCGATYEPTELQDPRSQISDAVPEMRETVHGWLDLWKVADPLREWIQGRERVWRSTIWNEVMNTVLPSCLFENVHEPRYKELKASLPKHKSKYAPGKKIQAQFESKADLERGRAMLAEAGIPTELLDGWAHRSITRDVAWGIPVPEGLDADLNGKTLYVWPDSLIAPMSFTQVALRAQGRDAAEWKAFWTDPEARVYQFIGQDNIYFYVLMQGAMWLGTQADTSRGPVAGELQMTDVFSVFHLLLEGEKMSKSRGNFFTGDQLLDEKGYAGDQLRYFLAQLSLPEKQSNFDFATFDEKNRFLAGPMNAAFEKPISAAHSKFGGKVPEGKLNEKVVQETQRIVQRYLKQMERADWPTLLFAIENYARQVNSLFTQFKPHDDRFPEAERRDALYTCFYVLKNLLIMLHPFVPATMERLRDSLRLPPSVLSIDELGTPIPAGHAIGEKQEFFPAVAGAGETAAGETSASVKG